MSALKKGEIFYTKIWETVRLTCHMLETLDLSGEVGENLLLDMEQHLKNRSG